MTRLFPTFRFSSLILICFVTCTSSAIYCEQLVRNFICQIPKRQLISKHSTSCFACTWFVFEHLISKLLAANDEVNQWEAISLHYWWTLDASVILFRQKLGSLILVHKMLQFYFSRFVRSIITRPILFHFHFHLGFLYMRYIMAQEFSTSLRHNRSKKLLNCLSLELCVRVFKYCHAKWDADELSTTCLNR